ncbi:MAG TPA: HAD family hydrolase [Ignavibacteriales bacterium]|nr:HAD family hydrolase [Ignavibacteriales bacterium]HEX3074053.1 HAD family hydrolase [Ignavibacteriales bacterium]
MRNFDAVIFDIDGTLTSTNDLIFASFNYVTKKKWNKIYAPEEIIKLFGPTENKILEDWFGPEAEPVKKDYYAFYSDNHSMAALYPGMDDILKYIKSKGVKLAVFTGKGRETTEITLKKLGAFDYFDFIVTGSDVAEHKPSAEGLIKILNLFKYNPSRVLMVGDAPADIIASRSAGIKVASVVWDSYAKEEVLKLSSDYYFQTVEEFDKFIKENV